MARFLILPLLVLAMTGCGPEKVPLSGATEQTQKPSVYVVNYPLAYFTQRLGGEHVDVVFPVPSDVNPAHWEPDGEMIARYQQADLILLNGADFAKWTLRSTLPSSRLALTTRTFQDDLIEVPDAITHRHGDEGEHSHAELATKTWLDPQLAIAQATVIREEIDHLLAGSPEMLTVPFEKLVAELKDLEKQFESTFETGSARWIASHSDLAYFGRRFDLELTFATWLNNDEPPSEEKWEKLKAGLDQNERAYVLFEGKPSGDVRTKLQELGVGIVIFETGANRPESGDYVDVMQRNLDRLKAALSNAPAAN